KYLHSHSLNMSTQKELAIKAIQTFDMDGIHSAIKEASGTFSESLLQQVKKAVEDLKTKTINSTEEEFKVIQKEVASGKDEVSTVINLVMKTVCDDFVKQM